MEYSLIDTHCHITCDRLYACIDEIIINAKQNKVNRMLIVCTGFEEFERALELQKREDVFDIALGFHPCDLYSFKEADYVRLEDILIHDQIIAVGEIGLDYHWKDVSPEDQKVALIRQIDLAKKHKKPVLIHMRDATKETVDILKSYPHIDGIMHCYSGSIETAKELLPLGFYFSFAGPLTFKNSRGAPEVVKALPIDRIFVETDAPYLTPHPHRGKQNEPMYVSFTFEKVCEIKEISKEEMAAQMQTNYQTLFQTNKSQ